MAWLNDFSVRVLEGNELAGGYVELAHNQQYKLQLRNSRGTACDAKVEIDGKDVGTFRIYTHTAIVLERPIQDASKFTFYRSGTAEAKQAQLQESDPNLGLVKVTFTPAFAIKPLPVVYQVNTVTSTPYTYYGDTSAVDSWGGNQTINVSYSANTPSSRGMSSGVETSALSRSGGTGLSGHSNQGFYNVDALNYDLSQQTTIFLRLVAKSDAPKPLTSFSTQVPPRID